MTGKDMWNIRMHQFDLTQKDFGAMLGLSESMVCRMEAGNRVITERTLNTLSLAQNQKKKPGPKGVNHE